jgi:drug/metabolite transporter (DMT)-like permease
MPIKKQHLAYCDLILSMTFLGSTLVLGKSLIAIFPIFLLLSIRFLIGTSFFSVFYFWKIKPAALYDMALTKRDWCLLFLQSLFGAFAFNLLMLLGLRLTSANSAAVLTSTMPAFISIFSFLILKETISKYKCMAIVFSILGLILVTANISSAAWNLEVILGNILILCAVISGALFPICTKLIVDKVATSLISLAFNFFGLILFLPFAIGEASNFIFTSISLFTWLLVIFYSLTANVLYLHFWNNGLRTITASTASLFVAVMPISTAILAYLFLGEILTISQISGIVFVILAITVGVYRG